MEAEFKDPQKAIKTLQSRYRDSSWKKYDIAVLNAWLGSRDKSEKLLQEIINEASEFDWQKERNAKAIEILDWVRNSEDLQVKLQSLVEKVRAMKGLESKPMGLTK